MTVLGNDSLMLGSLPEAERLWLATRLRSVTLAARTVVHEQGMRSEKLLFLRSGYVSLLVGFDDGFQVEVGAIGRDGAVGVSALLGADVETASAVAQVRTEALQISVDDVASHLEQLPKLKESLQLFQADLFAQTLQLHGCNAHHGLSARLARCLLGFQDRLGSSLLPLTHETLGSLLCAHRPSVSIALKQMERAGLIRCSIGALSIVDRLGVEQAACGCHEPLASALHRRLDRESRFESGPKFLRSVGL